MELTLGGSVTDGETPPGFISSNPRTKVELNSADTMYKHKKLCIFRVPPIETH